MHRSQLVSASAVPEARIRSSGSKVATIQRRAGDIEKEVAGLGWVCNEVCNQVCNEVLHRKRILSSVPYLPVPTFTLNGKLSASLLSSQPIENH